MPQSLLPGRSGLYAIGGAAGNLVGSLDWNQLVGELRAAALLILTRAGGEGVYSGGAVDETELATAGTAYPAVEVAILDDAGNPHYRVTTAATAITFTDTSGACTLYAVPSQVAGISPPTAEGGPADIDFVCQLTVTAAPLHSLALGTGSVTASAFTSYTEGAGVRKVWPGPTTALVLQDADGDEATITVAALAADRALTIPDPGAAASFVMTEGAQTVNGVKTLGSAPIVTPLTASRLLASDGSKALASVADLTSWIAGTANRLTVTSDGDGTLTLTVVDTPQLTGLLLSGLTATRLMASDGTKNLVSVADLTSWIAGTANRVTVTSDGDGTLTLSGPQDLHTAANPTFGTVTITDAYTTNWTDYAATSTIVGWSSFTTKVLQYRRVGSVVEVEFILAGTSDSTAVTFTVPVAAIARYFGVTMIDTRDNGVVLTTPGRCLIAASTGNCACYSNCASAAWTNSGTKLVQGYLRYRAA